MRCAWFFLAPKRSPMINGQEGDSESQRVWERNAHWPRSSYAVGEKPFLPTTHHREEDRRRQQKEIRGSTQIDEMAHHKINNAPIKKDLVFLFANVYYIAATTMKWVCTLFLKILFLVASPIFLSAHRVFDSEGSSLISWPLNINGAELQIVVS